MSESVVFSGPLRLRSTDGESWPDVDAKIVCDHDQRYFLAICKGTVEIDRVELEVTSSVFETTLGESTFEVITTAKILHFSATNLETISLWKKNFKEAFSKCSPFPRDPIFPEALLRQKDDTYEIVHSDNKPLGIVLERAGEWAAVKVALADAHEGVKIGSVLASINSTSCLLKSYEDTINLLRGWTPPLKLTFLNTPEMKGYLLRQVVQWKHRASLNNVPLKVVWKTRYFVLADGVLSFYSDATAAKNIGQITLFGSAVSLVPYEECGRYGVFKVSSGVSSLLLQAETVEHMFDWACALYHGMAMANGGGYMLAMEMQRAAENKSREDFTEEAIARSKSILEEEAARSALKQTKESVAEEPIAEKTDTVMTSRELMDRMAHKTDNASSAQTVAMITSDPDQTVFEMMKQNQVEEHVETSTTAAVDEAEAAVYRVPDEEDTPSAPRDHSADEADIRKVFKFYEKKSEEHNFTYISVAQFSIILRLTTGVKGNLYKEMQIFNSFDKGGKGMLTEDDFVEGWTNLADESAGDTYLKNLKKLVDKEDNMMI